MNAALRIAHFLSFAPCLAFGDTPAEQMPKPGPEVQKLAYYVGT